MAKFTQTTDSHLQRGHFQASGTGELLRHCCYAEATGSDALSDTATEYNQSETREDRASIASDTEKSSYVPSDSSESGWSTFGISNDDILKNDLKVSIFKLSSPRF